MGISFTLPILGAGGTYIATAMYFIKYPLARHKMNPGIKRVPLIAHRGGAGESYENTLVSYQHAVKTGAGMLELDVHLTKDGEVVVAHDQFLHRLTGVSTNIRDLNYDQLPNIKETINIDFHPGQYFCDNSVIKEQRSFVKFNEVLKQFPEININIDVKVKDEGLVEKVNQIIVENKAENKCVWGSFNKETTDLCYKTNPNIGLIFSMVQVVKLYLLFYLGLLAFVDIKETHLELPMPSIFLDDKYRSKVGNVGIAKISPIVLKIIDWIMMSPTLFSHLDKRGVTTYLWVLNNEEDYERAFNLGVHGVMTDYPTKLKQYLEKRNVGKSD